MTKRASTSQQPPPCNSQDPSRAPKAPGSRAIRTLIGVNAESAVPNDTGENRPYHQPHAHPGPETANREASLRPTPVPTSLGTATPHPPRSAPDRKSTRLNSSHLGI